MAAICLSVNYAEGLDKETIVSHETTLNVMGKAQPLIYRISRNIVETYE